MYSLQIIYSFALSSENEIFQNQILICWKIIYNLIKWVNVPIAEITKTNFVNYLLIYQGYFSIYFWCCKGYLTFGSVDVALPSHNHHLCTKIPHKSQYTVLKNLRDKAE